jgi:hypothetical protein
MPGPYVMVVSNGVLQNSSDVFTVLDPDSGGAATFSVPLSPNGLPPITDWACRTHVDAATLNALQNMNVTDFKAYVDQVAAVRGRQPVGSVTAFKNNVRISALGQNPDEFLATLNGGAGLQRMQG